MVDERIFAINEPTERQDVVKDYQTDDENEPSKQQFQNEMEHARESISQTINEIADNISTQAQTIKETVVKTLDWHEHVRAHPMAASIGTMAVGAFVGYVVVNSIQGRSNHKANGAHRALSQKSEESYSLQTPSPKQNNKPGFLSQIKHTQVYERLSHEAGNLVSQFIDEAVNVGKTVLVPAAIGKITETLNSSFADDKGVKKNNNRNSKADENSPTFATVDNKNQ